MSLQPLRLLLVEDSPEDAELLIRQIRKAGYEPDWCRVECPREYASLLHPDLDVIVSDFDLPRFNALEALELLRQSGLDIPFVIVSGTIGEDTAVAAMRAGASDYLLKDRLARLGQAIGRAVEKTSERRLRTEAEAALRASQEQFDLLAETIDEVFWISNADRSAFRYVSPGFEKIWGKTCAELYADAGTWLESLYEDDREALRAACFGEAKHYEVEYRIVRPDGMVRWVYDRGFPVKDACGQFSRMVGVAHDVTARKQLEANYLHAQKMEVLGQLAAGVAHDFNNLLAVIGGNASLISETRNLDREVEECAREVTMAVECATSLTGQLLMFSGKKVVQRKTIDLNEAVGNCARMLRRMLGAAIEIRLQLWPSSPHIHGDSSMIDQVLLNLVVNARDAMPGGGRLTMATGYQIPDGDDQPAMAFVSVTDTGLGIAAETIPRLFEPFFTTKDAGRGTGLGLATVAEILRQHQGLCEIESEVGCGTTFRVLLPSCAPPDLPNPLPGPTAAESVGGSRVVDD